MPIYSMTYAICNVGRASIHHHQDQLCPCDTLPKQHNHKTHLRDFHSKHSHMTHLRDVYSKHLMMNNHHLQNHKSLFPQTLSILQSYALHSAFFKCQLLSNCISLSKIPNLDNNNNKKNVNFHKNIRQKIFSSAINAPAKVKYKARPSKRVGGWNLSKK